jgi:toxin ParE1/3/4
MKIRYSPQAREDLRDIVSYLDERSPVGAENVMRAIYAGIQFLAENPMASQETSLAEIRVKIVRRYNFKIFYRIDGNTVELIHIRHAVRRPFTS